MPEQFLDYASRGGVVSLLLAIVVGNLRGWWVSGKTYNELKADRDQWKTFALRSRDLARLATDLPSDASWDGLARSIPS